MDVVDIGNVAKIEEDLNRLIERRAQGANHANLEAERERARDARRTHAVHVENLRGWVEHYGAQALMFHDAAARACEQRDWARETLHKLETNERETA